MHHRHWRGLGSGPAHQHRRWWPLSTCLAGSERRALRTALATAVLLIFVVLLRAPVQQAHQQAASDRHDGGSNPAAFLDAANQTARPSLDDFISAKCSDVREELDDLIRRTSLSFWQPQRRSMWQRLLPTFLSLPPPQRPPPDWHNVSDTTFYVKEDSLYISAAAERGRMTPSFWEVLSYIHERMRLPDLILPINVADEPGSGADNPLPIFGYCRDDSSADILFPYAVDGIKLLRPPKSEAAAPAPDSPDFAEAQLSGRAGPYDPRKPIAVWRGSTGGNGGLPKGRMALMNLSLARPDLVDAGLMDWKEEVMGPDLGRLKPPMSFLEQVNTYQMLLWVPGNCAAVRLGAQLASDAVVLMLDSPEIEWYQPLLQPWVHYIPVAFNAATGRVGLEEAVQWARSHQEEMARISARATELARRFLLRDGLDCYTAQLLQAVSGMMPANVTLPDDAIPDPFAAAAAEESKQAQPDASAESMSEASEQQQPGLSEEVRPEAATAEEQPTASATEEQQQASEGEPPDAAEVDNSSAAAEDQSDAEESVPDASHEDQADASEEERPHALEEARPDAADPDRPAVAENGQTPSDVGTLPAEEKNPQPGSGGPATGNSEVQPDVS